VSQYYTVSEVDARFVNMKAIDPDTNLGDSDDKIATQHAVKACVDRRPELGEANTASNLSGGTGLFKEKVRVNLQFKSVQAGDNVRIVEDSDTITTSASTGSDGGTGGHTIQDDGNLLAVCPNLNFTGRYRRPILAVQRF
jgi:hypothetical protein